MRHCLCKKHMQKATAKDLGLVKKKKKKSCWINGPCSALVVSHLEWRCADKWQTTALFLCWNVNVGRGKCSENFVHGTGNPDVICDCTCHGLTCGVHPYFRIRLIESFLVSTTVDVKLCLTLVGWWWWQSESLDKCCQNKEWNGRASPPPCTVERAGEGGAEQRLGYEAGEQLDLEPLMKPSVCSGQAVPRQEHAPCTWSTRVDLCCRWGRFDSF